MNKIHVTYKNLLLPITFIAATLISACDNDKDAMAEAEKNQEKYMQKIQQKEHQQSLDLNDKPQIQKAIPTINANGEAK
ncbi:lipoprotein EnvF, partial [Salmonella enterica subsp. enterica serovar Typhimurium]